MHETKFIVTSKRRDAKKNDEALIRLEDVIRASQCLLVCALAQESSSIKDTK